MAHNLSNNPKFESSHTNLELEVLSEEESATICGGHTVYTNGGQPLPEQLPQESLNGIYVAYRKGHNGWIADPGNHH